MKNSTRIEEYLDKATGGTVDEPLPDAITRIEKWLAKIAGEDVETPEITEGSPRIEKFLAAIAGEDVELPEITEGSPRIEKFLAQAAGETVEDLPDPITRIEGFLAELQGGEQPVLLTYTGNLPATITAVAHAIHSLTRYGLCTQPAAPMYASITQDGKCVQDGTPTPDAPVDIVTNNGAIKVSPNLANMVSDNIVVGKYINNSGVETVDTYNFFYAPYVPVTPGGTYTMATSSSIWYFSVMQYDSSQNFLRRTVWGATNTPVGTEKTFDVGADCAYIRFGSNMKKAAISEADVLAVNWMLTETATALDYRPYGEVYVDGTAEVLSVGGQNRIVPNLLGVGSYKDTYELISGLDTHNIGIKVLDGTEAWTNLSNYYNLSKTDLNTDSTVLPQNSTSIICTHLVAKSGLFIDGVGVGASYVNFKYDAIAATLDAWKAFLAAQYRAGTPVIMLYPLATATTETVTVAPIDRTYPQTITATAEVSDITVTETHADVSTPSPYTPLPVWCNNGEIKYGWHDIITTSQLSGYGTYVNPAESPTTRAYRRFNNLPNGTYQFSVSGNYEIIVQWRDPADPSDGTAQGYENLSEWMTSGVVTLNKSTGGYGVAVRKASGTGEITMTNFNGVLRVAEHGIYTDGTPEVLTVSGGNLANMVAGNIDLGKIIYDTGSVANSVYNFVYNKYIPVEAGQNYVMYGRKKSDNTISAYNRICWYDENKGWISRATYTEDTIGSAVAPNNAAFARFTVAPVDSADRLTLDAVLAYDWTFAKATEEIPYQPYVEPQTATVEMLLGVGDYKDDVELIGGLLTHKVGVKVLTGHETGWTKSTTRPNTYIETNLFSDKPINRVGLCSHFIVSDDGNALNSPGYLVFGSATVSANFSAPTDLDTVQKFKDWLAAQHAAGTPVIVVYPLATETTEQTTPQHLVTHKGVNVVDSTANVEPVEVEIEYYGTEEEGNRSTPMLGMRSMPTDDPVEEEPVEEEPNEPVGDEPEGEGPEDEHPIEDAPSDEAEEGTAEESEDAEEEGKGEGDER